MLFSNLAAADIAGFGAARFSDGAIVARFGENGWNRRHQ
jgi:hypothetical protein